MSIFGTLIDDLNDKTVNGAIHYFRRFFFAAAVLCLASCDDKKPEDILSRAEMVETMEELYIAEEKINHLGLARDSTKQIFEVMKTRVFEEAGMTDSVFRKSFDYYMEHPMEMELIYTALVDTLQLREQRAPLRFNNK